MSRSYTDWRGRRRSSPSASVRAVLRAMGAEGGSPPVSPVLTAFRGERVALRGRIRLEGGAQIDARGELSAGVPDGYHLFDDGQSERLLVVAPSSCPAAPRGWGWAVQLYGARSEASWGMGDLGDLRRLARWSASLGAGVLQVSPLHAALPGHPQQASPYFASSRRYRNLLYLRVEEVPGAAGQADVERLARQGRELNRLPLVDRDRVLDLKLAALEAIYVARPPGRDFDAYRRRQGESLEQFATFNALYELHGPGWRAWPDGHDHPKSAGTRRFRSMRAGRIRFHAWLQWLLDQQVRAAGAGLGLVHDLAVGVDPEGADAWAWQDVFAEGMAVGAPPDEFNVKGQSWGLPPFDPWKLRSARYGPFLETIRSALAGAAGVRLDHVMSLFRLWWVPAGGGPADGVYVRYPARDLLAILALEAHRAGAFVVGEDLGTVVPAVRAELRRRGVLSYRLLWFEDREPARYPELALAAVTTHDLPTIAGLWTGLDLERQRAAGLQPNEASTQAIVERLERLTGLPRGADPALVIQGTHAALAAAPSRLLAATLEDAACAEERPNLPGTLDERPNWRIPLPLALEQLERAPLPRRIAAALNER